jgi:thioredoxin-dependent peroxiredoxin
MLPKVKVGDDAPELTLPDQNGDTHTLSDYRGQWVLVYFYPRDNTPGCTIEACAMRDHFPEFEKLDVRVFGISTDSAKKHANFAKKYNLPFTLLADDNQEAVEVFGVWGLKKFMGREFMGTHRMSFLIDPSGKIVKIYEKVKVATHAEEVLADRRAMD